LKVTVEASASSANFGPGFDVFALALDSPRDRLTLKAERAGRLSISITSLAGIETPSSASRNAAGVVCDAIARDHAIRQKILVEITKGVPIGQGMGSSGASAAGAAFGMNHLFDLGMKDDDLIFYAGKGEQATSGTAHYDNVSASILGGFVVVKGGERPTAVGYDAPKGMRLCVATPAVSLPKRKTEFARSILPARLRLDQMVSNVANASIIVSGFARGDIRMIGSGMSDKVVEEARKKMIPGYDAVRKAGCDAGSAGVCISGAGPSMMAVVDVGKVDPRSVLRAMIEGFRSKDAKATGFVTAPGKGVIVI
jgi:homoserine kinase